jgi:hypothetical protein
VSGTITLRCSPYRPTTDLRPGLPYSFRPPRANTGGTVAFCRLTPILLFHMPLWHSRAVTPEELEQHAETLELVNSEISARLDRLADSDAKIDTKAVALAGYAVAAATFLATRHPQAVLAVIFYIFGALSAGLAAAAYAVGAYRDVPDPRALLTRYASKPKSATLAALAAERVKAFEVNHRKHERKALLWRISLGSLAVAVTLMVASILVQTSGHDSTATTGRTGKQPSASAAASPAGR